jgi:nucleoside-diphosphate-sugar epimerase
VSRVLVTGATGFVGRHALEPLRARGLDVVSASRADGVDLLEPGAAERFVRRVRPTHLLHMAWYAEHGRFWTSRENVRWVEGSLALLRAFAAVGGRRAVLAGSCAEYDWDVAGTCREDITPVRPATLYGAAKHGLHTVATPFASQEGFELAWGRIFFAFGPHEPEGRIVPAVARALLAGEEARVTHGRQVRDFLAVEELGDAFAALVAADGVQGAVNVASGRALELRRLVGAVADAAGRPELVRYGAIEARPGEPDELVADVTRLRDDVGWMPRETLEEGVARAVAWWRGR